MNYFEKFFDCKILPLRNAPWLAKDSFNIFSWVKVRKLQKVFLFSLYFKKNETNHFPSTFPIIYVKKLRDSDLVQFLKMGRKWKYVPSEISQPLTNMGQDILKVSVSFQLDMKIFKTVHIENIKFEPLDKQFFPHFYWMGYLKLLWIFRI